MNYAITITNAALELSLQTTNPFLIHAVMSLANDAVKPLPELPKLEQARTDGSPAPAAAAAAGMQEVVSPPAKAVKPAPAKKKSAPAADAPAPLPLAIDIPAPAAASSKALQDQISEEAMAAIARNRPAVNALIAEYCPEGYSPPNFSGFKHDLEKLLDFRRRLPGITAETLLDADGRLV